MDAFYEGWDFAIGKGAVSNDGGDEPQKIYVGVSQRVSKRNHSYSLFGLPELEYFPHDLLPYSLWLDICTLCNLLLSQGYWGFF